MSSSTSAGPPASQADTVVIPESPTRRVRKLLSYPDLPKLQTGTAAISGLSAADANPPGYTFSRRPTGHTRTRPGPTRSNSHTRGRVPMDPFESLDDDRASSRQTLQSTLEDIRRLLLPFYRLLLPAERLEGLLKKVKPDLTSLPTASTLTEGDWETLVNMSRQRYLVP
jgi:hypothetical protein